VTNSAQLNLIRFSSPQIFLPQHQHRRQFLKAFPHKFSGLQPVVMLIPDRLQR
jgi:hypothetical protein